MAETILTPGSDSDNTDEVQSTTVNYLIKDNYLGEFETEDDIAKVRRNLGILPDDTFYTKAETNTEINTAINNAIQFYLTQEDPHGILPIVEDMLDGVIKNDGSIPFELPQSGVWPLKDEHLTTKKFVTSLLKEHLDAEDPHEILPEVIKLLEDYVIKSNVYTKEEVYSKSELNEFKKKVVLNDGSVSFTKPQRGVYPQLDSHLTTRKYVDDVLTAHTSDTTNPHNFMTTLNNRLANYIKRKDVYDKTQTYSKSLIDSIIYQLVLEAVDAITNEEFISIYDKLEDIRKLNYVKSDGSVSFAAPLSGVDALEDNQFTTLKLVSSLITKEIPQLVWVTSGPVETTVGFVEDNLEVPAQMTFQEIMDAIFYSKKIAFYVPNYVSISDKASITICLHGGLETTDYVELLQGEESIYIFDKSEFETGCVTVEVGPIMEDTDFTLNVHYTNGYVYTETKTISCVYPVFVGTMPKWKGANTVTMDYLKELAISDSLNNKFDIINPDNPEIEIEYSFEDPELRNPFVVIPEKYPDLYSMDTEHQSFGIDAFDVITMIPLHIDGVEDSIIYKIYVYKQAVSALNLNVTFKFK